MTRIQEVEWDQNRTTKQKNKPQNIHIHTQSFESSPLEKTNVYNKIVRYKIWLQNRYHISNSSKQDKLETMTKRELPPRRTKGRGRERERESLFKCGVKNTIRRSQNTNHYFEFCSTIHCEGNCRQGKKDKFRLTHVPFMPGSESNVFKSSPKFNTLDFLLLPLKTRRGSGEWRGWSSVTAESLESQHPKPGRVEASLQEISSSEKHEWARKRPETTSQPRLT